MWPWYFQRFQIRKRHPCSSLSASANDEMMRFNHYFNSLLMFVTFQNKTEVIQARERRHLAKITLACIRTRSHETSHLLLLILQIWSGRSDWADLLLLFVLTGRWISLLHLITAETITEEEAAFFFSRFALLQLLWLWEMNEEEGRELWRESGQVAAPVKC